MSNDGSTYTFSNASGPLAQAAPGKVLLLEGQDAVVVKSVFQTAAFAGFPNVSFMVDKLAGSGGR